MESYALEMSSLLHSYTLPFTFILAFVYVIIGSIYRLYFSPSARYPGPRLAALTYWYEFYYDVVCKGRYSWKIRDLHHRYGRLHTEAIS